MFEITDDIKADVLAALEANGTNIVATGASWYPWLMLHHEVHFPVIAVGDYFVAVDDCQIRIKEPPGLRYVYSTIYVCRPADWRAQFKALPLFDQLQLLLVQPALYDVLEWHHCAACADYHPIDLQRCPDVKRTAFFPTSDYQQLEYFSTPWQIRFKQEQGGGGDGCQCEQHKC